MFHSAQHFDVRHGAVGHDDEGTHHAPLNAVTIGFFGVHSRAVDEFNHLLFAARERGFVGNIVVFVDFEINGGTGGIGAAVHVCCLRFCSGRNKARSYKGYTPGATYFMEKIFQSHFML